MNDLRLMLLGIGLFIIAFIYVWGTFIQKSQDRSRTRKTTTFKRDSFSDINIMPDYDDDEISAERLAEIDKFLSNPVSPDVYSSDFSLHTKAIEIDAQEIDLSKSVANQSTASNIDKQTSQDQDKDRSSQQGHHDQIISLLIKASADKEFSGTRILEVAEAVGLKHGRMKIFHHYGDDDIARQKAIFSLADMYEPGYFELDEMTTFTTKGLNLFMQLPVSINSMTAFDLMQETAMRLADILEAEIWSTQHRPIDEKALQAIRDVISASCQD